MVEYIDKETTAYRLLKNGVKRKIVERAVLNVPANDVRENVKGEWIYKKGDMVTCDDGWSCSHCKCTYHTRVPYFKDFNFCPNCGADMRGANDDKC